MSKLEDSKIKVYTPDQVANILQLSSATVYGLIKKGEIVAKKLGNTYRIPASSLTFVFTGLDKDLLEAEQIDRQTIKKVQAELSKVRSKLGE